MCLYILNLQNYKRGGSLYRGKKCIDGTEDATEYVNNPCLFVIMTSV